MPPLKAVNHLLDRLSHTLRVLGAVELPDTLPVPLGFKMPPQFEAGLSCALRAVRIEQDTTEILYPDESDSDALVAALKKANLYILTECERTPARDEVSFAIAKCLVDAGVV